MLVHFNSKLFSLSSSIWCCRVCFLIKADFAIPSRIMKNKKLVKSLLRAPKALKDNFWIVFKKEIWLILSYKTLFGMVITFPAEQWIMRRFEGWFLIQCIHFLVLFIAVSILCLGFLLVEHFMTKTRWMKKFLVGLITLTKKNDYYRLELSLYILIGAILDNGIKQISEDFIIQELLLMKLFVISLTMLIVQIINRKN